MPNRTFAAPGTGQYRFGFSGKETDNEPYGPGGLSDDGMRMVYISAKNPQTAQIEIEHTETGGAVEVQFFEIECCGCPFAGH